MKATLEFDLPEETQEWRLHTHATELSVALWQVQNMLRGYWKHADLEGMTAERLINDIWERFHDIAGAVMEATE